MALSQLRNITNIQNAQKSTGPRTEAGKKRASLNALRHGITSQITVLPGEDMVAFQTFGKGFIADFKPVGSFESQLVQTIIELQWSLNRCRAHEASIFALGHEHNADLIDTADENIQTALASAMTLRESTDVLKTLSLYEQRLDRRFQTAIKQLRETQKIRKTQEEKDLVKALPIRTEKILNGLPFDPAEFGFVCSNDQLDLWVHVFNAGSRAQKARDARDAAAIAAQSEENTN
jgi:hypothetical protein